MCYYLSFGNFTFTAPVIKESVKVVPSVYKKECASCFLFSSHLKHDHPSLLFSLSLHLSQSVFLSLCFLLREARNCVTPPSLLLKTGTIISHAKEEALVGDLVFLLRLSSAFCCV